MSGVERDKIKSLIESRENLEKSKFLIVGKESSGSNIIRNLFNKNFNEDDLKSGDLAVKNLNIGKETSVTFSSKFEVKNGLLDFSSFDYIICGISLLKKRVNIQSLKLINNIITSNGNVIIALTDVEFLDLREFEEMKEIIAREINNEIEIISVMDLDISSKYNQWGDLVESIKNNLDSNSKVSFMKSQIIDNSFKDNMCDETVRFYIELFNELEVETLSEADLVYIQTYMVSEILGLYPHGDEVRQVVIDLVEGNISKLVAIKREKIEVILKVEEEERLRLKAEEDERLKVEEEARLAEEEKLRLEEEARVAEEDRVKIEEEAKLKAQEDARIAEEERLRVEEEERIAEEKRIKEETEKKIKLEEEKRAAEEAEKIRIKKERIEAKEKARLQVEEEKRKRIEAEAKRKKAEEDLKIKEEKLNQQRIDLIELRKLEEERKIINEKIKKLNKSLRKNAIEDVDSTIEDMIIEASFTVDDSDGIEPKHAVNEIEARIDGIIYEAIAIRMEDLIEQVRNEIKEKLKDNSII